MNIFEVLKNVERQILYECVIYTQQKIISKDITKIEDNMKWILSLGMIILGFGVYGYFVINREGMTITSWWRTPEKNKAVGGHPYSWHLLGLAYDIVPASEQNNRTLQRLGFHTLNEGGHIHAQWIGRG